MCVVLLSLRCVLVMKLGSIIGNGPVEEGRSTTDDGVETAGHGDAAVTSSLVDGVTTGT